MGWLQKLPIASLFFAVAIAAAPFLLASDRTRSTTDFEASRETARTFLVRNPQLEVDNLGELILESDWLSEMRSAAASSEGGGPVELPARMRARSQARLDALIEQAYELRIDGDPAWRYGVLDARSPARNYVVHAFVHENLSGIVLSALVVLLVGAALEWTWGSLIYAAFVLAAIPITAQCYRIFDASSGVPWSGAAGLAGALLGAYFIRGLGGQFVVPGWIVLPVWLGVESFVVRGFWIDDLGGVPWATICAAVGIGALVAGSLRLTNFESKAESRAAKRSNRGPNPIVARAARLRSDGDPHQAFDLIQAAWRENPSNEEVAEAFYSIAVEVGKPEAAGEAIIPSLRKALRGGDLPQAIEFWLPLATRESDLNLEATVAVRLGEALLDAGHPTEALFTLRRALDTGVSSAHAARIVKVARDLDEGLARRAATIALHDANLDPKIRKQLEPLIAVPSDIEPSTASATESDLDVEADPNEAILQAQSLHAGALSLETLSQTSVSPDGAESNRDVRLESQVSNDILSHWSDRDATTTQSGLDLSSDLAEDLADETMLDSTTVESKILGKIDFGEQRGPRDSMDADTDLTPLIDAFDDQTSPFVSSELEAGAGPSQDDQRTIVFDQAAAIVPPTRRIPRSESSHDGSGGAGSPDGPRRRSMKILDAQPLATSDEWIEIDVASRGKSKLPFSRIQTIAMAAVSGLSKRPVLIVDFVLNGSGGDAEPMRLIRMRSDRFDPLILEPAAANPLAALTSWVGRLQRDSNANCLPSRSLLDGKFARFESLEAYEREVLMGVRDAES